MATTTTTTSSHEAATHARLQRTLLACGVIAPALHVATDVALALRYDGYSFRDQTISELNAIGAPTRPLNIALLLVSDTLLAAFGVGVWRFARGDRKLRIAGAALVALGLFAYWSLPFASMHVREAEESISDTLHVLGLPVAGTLLALTIGFGAASRGSWFRAYSVATVAIVLTFGVWSGMDGSRVADNLATPWLGIKERTSVYAYQLWLIAFAITLLRTPTAAQLPRRSRRGPG